MPLPPPFHMPSKTTLLLPASACEKPLKFVAVPGTRKDESTIRVAPGVPNVAVYTPAPPPYVAANATLLPLIVAIKICVNSAASPGAVEVVSTIGVMPEAPAVPVYRPQPVLDHRPTSATLLPLMAGDPLNEVK